VPSKIATEGTKVYRTADCFFESGEYRQQMAPMQVKFLSFEIFACALQGGSTILVPATK
jgi:hypothetical protein